MDVELISRVAAVEHMKSMAGCATCDNYNYVRCRACSWDDAMNIVEEMPTIDTIPVEWLREYDDAFDNVLPISNALRAWEEGRLNNG